MYSDCPGKGCFLCNLYVFLADFVIAVGRSIQTFFFFSFKSQKFFNGCKNLN